MGEEIAFENGRISDSQGLVTLTLTHTAYRHASVIDLCLHTKFHWNRRNLLWTNGHTYGWADEYLRPTLLGWLGVDLIKALVRLWLLIVKFSVHKGNPHERINRNNFNTSRNAKLTSVSSDYCSSSRMVSDTSQATVNPRCTLPWQITASSVYVDIRGKKTAKILQFYHAMLC